MVDPNYAFSLVSYGDMVVEVAKSRQWKMDMHVLSWSLWRDAT